MHSMICRNFPGYHLPSMDTQSSDRRFGLRSARKELLAIGALAAAVLILLVSGGPAKMERVQAAAPFHLQEATIADVHDAIRKRQLTCVDLVQLYLARAAAYNGISVEGKVVNGVMIG